MPHFFKSSSVGLKMTLKGGWTTLSLRPFKRSSMSRVASPLHPYVPKVAHFFPLILTLNIMSIISQTGRSASPFIVDEPYKTTISLLLGSFLGVLQSLYALMYFHMSVRRMGPWLGAINWIFKPLIFSIASSIFFR